MLRMGCHLGLLLLPIDRLHGRLLLQRGKKTGAWNTLLSSKRYVHSIQVRVDIPYKAVVPSSDRTEVAQGSAPGTFPDSNLLPSLP